MDQTSGKQIITLLANDASSSSVNISRVGVTTGGFMHIFAHLHTALRTEGKHVRYELIPRSGRASKTKYMVNFFSSLGAIFKEILSFKNCKISWVAKGLISSYILCKILSF